jgi:hypothetical protein
MKIKKTKKTEFVFIGKNFASIERAEVKKNRLIQDGYQLISKNTKKLTFQL